ncbi:SDR family oxidoreductase [Pontimonas sp.]|jgi:NAD(P)-dependent dehydrogenase (short-subunit alcohol dehydrogenase family)|uniref:SDR family NAD(P)-dependent oxidoreductase n=1 Tax=Pontimonas sp. TaxID=2304492 RepID=UPI0028709E1D|nr:SDR family oxidoreductase [Pontimonas sp.]MDR9396284.1 SDR family oxidoreductase [Pontimonas sp.]MDR9433815.1 SDR family oxidoreductase [Pontimonas sp.]
MSERKVAVVTGATSGIGLVVAQTLASDGFFVVVTGRSQSRGEAAVASIGDSAIFIAADLVQPGAPAKLIEDTLAQCGRLDVLVNNAAIDHTNDLLEVGDDEIRETFETNTFAPMSTMIAAARVMKEQGDGGSIINVTSRLASIGVPTMGVYSASKGAMLAFTTAGAIDLAPFNIRVNAVAPGMTRTPLYEEWIQSLDNPEEKARQVAEAVPMGRIAEPEDVAAVISFLASPEASYLTGTSIPVEGGYLAK